MLRRRRAAIINKQSVPYGSTKVEYLECTGTQHLIVSNVYANQNHEVSAEFAANFHNNDDVIILFGSRTAWRNSACAVTYGLGETFDITNTGFAHFENQSPKFISLPYHGKRTKINLSKNGLKLNDEIVAQFDEVKNFTSSNPYCICSTYTPNIDSRKMAGKIYNFNIKDSNKDVTKLIPSIDKTGKPCMFDLVTRKNFYNAGTGQFKYIRPNGLPSDYTQVEYLESTGTQWIDTGVILKSNDFHFTIKYALLGSKQNERLLQGSNFTWVCSLAGNGYGWITLPKKDGGRIGGEFHLIHTKGEPIILEFKAEEVIKNGTKLDINASMSQITNYDSLQDTNLSLKLCSFGDPTQYTSERFVGKIFNLKLDINEIKNNFVPCLDPTGTPCMYDTITQQPFYNSGTGDFLYPSPTSAVTYSLRRPQAEWAKMTDTGVHKIYHTPIGYEGSLEEYAIKNNYKRLVETESPNEEGKYYSFRWVETDDTLTTEWFEIDPPQEEIIEENLDNPTE